MALSLPHGDRRSRRARRPCLLPGLLVASGLLLAPASVSASWFRVYQGLINGGYVIPTASGGLAFATEHRDVPDSLISQTVVLNFDSDGKVLWSTAIGGPDEFPPRALSQAPDGGFHVSLVDDWGGGVFLMHYHLDADGTPVWHDLFTSSMGPGSRGNLAGNVAARDGGALLCGNLDRDGQPPTRPPWIVRLTPSGSWAWSMDAGLAAGLATSCRLDVDDGFLVTVVGSTASAEPRFLLLKLDDQGQPLLWRRFESTFGLQGLRSVLPLAGGDYLIAGSIHTAASPSRAAWLARLDDSGNIRWQRTYASAAADDEFLAIAVAAGGGYFAYGMTATDALVLRLDGAGDIVWQKRLPGFQATSATIDAAGAFVIAGATATGAPYAHDSFLASLDDAGPPACSNFIDANLVAGVADASSVAEALTPAPVDQGGYPDPSYTWPGPLLSFETACDSGCSSQLARVTRLLAGRRNDDVWMQWNPDPAASGYNVWFVADKTVIDRARIDSSPPALGVPGCADPVPTRASSCLQAGGVRVAPALELYQVRASCTPGFEGP